MADVGQFYWELIQKDGTVIDIPPSAVETVKRRWDSNEPIHTTEGSVPANQIAAFRPTSRKATSTELIEAASQAFNEPVESGEGVKARWVKKMVTHVEYRKHYGSIPSYHRLNDIAGMVEIAFVLPVHSIDTNNVLYCSQDEIKRLTSK